MEALTTHAARSPQGSLGYNAETFTGNVDVHVASLRQKLESDTRQPQLIATVPGSVISLLLG